MQIRRAWNVFVTDGRLRDYFANSVSHRIEEDDQAQMTWGYNQVELVKDFVERCDTIFGQNNPKTFEAALALANQIDYSELVV
jgi:hypothetical protein